MKKVYTIYQAIGPNNKKYIGFTSTSLTKRRSRHENDAKLGKTTSIFHKALIKYNFKFKWRILKIFYNKKEAFKSEKFYIAKYKTKGKNGYNMTYGGEGKPGRKVSKKTLERMRLSAIKQHKNKNGKTYKHINSLKIAVIRSDGKEYESFHAAARELNTSASWIREVALGKQRSVFGYTFKTKDKKLQVIKKENREKMELKQASRKKPVIDCNGIIYDSISSAAAVLEGNISNLSSHLRHERKSFRGLTFKFYKG